MISCILAKFRTYLISVENWYIETNAFFKSIMTHDINCMGLFTSSSPYDCYKIQSFLATEVFGLTWIFFVVTNQLFVHWCPLLETPLPKGFKLLPSENITTEPCWLYWHKESSLDVISRSEELHQVGSFWNETFPSIAKKDYTKWKE